MAIEGDVTVIWAWAGQMGVAQDRRVAPKPESTMGSDRRGNANLATTLRSANGLTLDAAYGSIWPGLHVGDEGLQAIRIR
jgi:hypothetical protein